MSKHVLKNVRLYTGGADLTGQSNKIEVAAEVEEKDITTWGSTDASGELWKEVIAGIASATISAEGFWEASDTSKVDDDAWAALGGAGAWTTFPHSLTAGPGDVAWLTNMLRSQYQLLGGTGEVAPWKSGGTSTWPLVRGVGLHAPGTARTATGSGTAVEHVAVGSGQQLYAALHVLSVSGTTPSITVKVQSDDNSGMTTPTDRITFTAAAARGGQIARLAGPITDTYYRVSWTISGATPSFLVLASVGVF